MWSTIQHILFKSTWRFLMRRLRHESILISLRRLVTMLQMLSTRLTYPINLLVIILLKVVDAICKFDMAPALLAILLMVLILHILFNRPRGVWHDALCVVISAYVILGLPLCLTWSLGAILKYLRCVNVIFFGKPVLVLFVDTNVMAEMLVWRFWKNVLLVKSHISVRIGHPVLNGGGLVIV